MSELTDLDLQIITNDLINSMEFVFQRKRFTQLAKESGRNHTDGDSFFVDLKDVGLDAYNNKYAINHSTLLKFDNPSFRLDAFAYDFTEKKNSDCIDAIKDCIISVYDYHNTHYYYNYKKDMYENPFQNDKIDLLIKELIEKKIIIFDESNPNDYRKAEFGEEFVQYLSALCQMTIPTDYLFHRENICKYIYKEYHDGKVIRTLYLGLNYNDFKEKLRQELSSKELHKYNLEEIRKKLPENYRIDLTPEYLTNIQSEEVEKMLSDDGYFDEKIFRCRERRIHFVIYYQ